MRMTLRVAKGWQAALRATASSLARQHFLYLLPLPHGQGSLRPGSAMVVGTYEPRRTHPLYRDVLTDANLTSCCSPATATSPTPLGVAGASGPTALFILLTIGASRVAGPAASGVSTTGASASAARSMAAGCGRRRRRCASANRPLPPGRGGPAQGAGRRRATAASVPRKPFSIDFYTGLD
jgi:hypothetical protein